MEEAKVAELRKAVRHQLQQAGIKSVLHQLLLEYQRAGEVVTPDDALDVLQGRGVIDQLVRTVRPPQPALENLVQVSNVGPLNPAELPPGKAFLSVKILGGRAFTDFIARPPSSSPSLQHQQLHLSLELFGNRFTCSSVPAGPEPPFAGEAFFPLPSANSSTIGPPLSGPDPLSLLSLRQGLHTVVVATTPMAGQGEGEGAGGPSGSSAAHLAASLAVRREVVALGTAEWRTALLRRGKVVVAVQLGAGQGAPGALPAAASPAGALTLQLELRPGFSAALDEGLLRSQQRVEHARDADVMAAFVARAKTWWGEYVSQNLAFKSRPIKVLATGEDGCQYPVCCFLRPLQLGRRLAGAREAARWVSLMARREDGLLLPGGGGGGGGAGEAGTGSWCLLHTVLAAGVVSKEEQAVLLCCLLLGFGLDAWVAVGRLQDGSVHSWVLTRGPLAAPCFWEPSTAVRYTLTDVETWPYQSVDCVFNHQRLYANCQCDDSAFGTSFVFEDGSLWRELDMPPQELPAMPWSVVPLARTSISDPSELELHLETRLRAAAEAHRRVVLGGSGGITTVWDEHLAQLLMPALMAYEHEAIHSEVAPGNDDFQQAIKRAVPLGWVFKAMPQHHTHTCSDLHVKAMMEDEQMLDILGTVASTAIFTLRVKVFAYPENLTSVWVMLAVKYCAVA